LLWLLGNHLRPGLGPVVTFVTAGLIGLLGAALFFFRFGQSSTKLHR
jgi:hypothetical protein